MVITINVENGYAAKYFCGNSNSLIKDNFLTRNLFKAEVEIW